MNRFLTTCFILTLLLGSQSWADLVCSVHDGDTFTTCQGKKVRIWGIDAPELGQPYSKDSRDYLKKLLIDRDASLKCQGRSYKRSVCRVMLTLNGQPMDIGSELVGWGYAYDSVEYSKGQYASAEAFARMLGRGVWILPNGGIRPWDWRKSKRRG